MKRLILSLIVFNCLSLTLKAQYDSDSVVNKQEHGSQYLLSEPFKNNCTGFDIFQYMPIYGNPIDHPTLCYQNWIVNTNYSNSGSYILTNTTHSHSLHCYTVDIAQPFYSDSLLTVIGVAIYFPSRYFLAQDAFLCIADKNLNIRQKTKLTDIPIDINENLQRCTYWLNYEEFWFDTAVNVKDLFYIIFDAPKPEPYTGYNWDGNHGDFFKTEFNKNFYLQYPNSNKIVGASDNEHCPAEMLPLIKRYHLIKPDTSWIHPLFNPNTTIDFSTSDTTWHSVKDEPVSVPSRGNDNYWLHQNVTAYYIFPIFGEFDSTLANINAEPIDTTSNPQDSTSTNPNDSTTDSSSVRTIEVGKFTHIFPNPADDIVNIQCSFMITDIEIFNAQGIKTEDLHLNAYTASIDVSHYAKGTYLINIKTRSGSCNKKFVVN